MRTSQLDIGLLLSVFLVPALALAEPAAFYLWKSKTSTAQVCAQTSPGAFWDKANGPFKDAHCEKIKPNDPYPQIPQIPLNLLFAHPKPKNSDKSF